MKDGFGAVGFFNYFLDVSAKYWPPNLEKVNSEVVWSPGAFPWAMFLTISSTSSKDAGLIILWVYSGETNQGIASIIFEIAPLLLISGSKRRSR
jgi:hypothetical protein